MAVHVTRCPHCRTTFRVRDEHLQVANGAVRCGSCLQVFKAAEHFANEEDLAKPAAANKTSEATSTESPAGKNSSEAKAPEKPATKIAPATKAEQKPTPTPTPTEITPTEELIHDDMDEASDDDDGLIHDDMDQDDDDVPDIIHDDPMVDFGIRAPDHLDRPTPRNDLELDASVFELKNASTDTLDLIDPGADSMSFQTDKDPDEAWADALLDDDETVEEITLGGLDLADNSDFEVHANEASEDEFSHFMAGKEEDDFNGFADDEDSLHLSGDDDLEAEIQEVDLSGDSISGLQEDPLELQKKASSASIAWGWASASVIMILIALSQTLYFKFDQWSRTPQWRPYYSQICSVVGCQLPEIQNLKSMSTQHLVVRSHPKLQRALVVDTLLQNHADYKQPFPDLELVFSDLNNNVVASRQFIPTEYLSGELSGQKSMPTHAPIHIALEIADPGPEAVSYAIRLKGNQ